MPHGSQVAPPSRAMQLRAASEHDSPHAQHGWYAEPQSGVPAASRDRGKDTDERALLLLADSRIATAAVHSPMGWVGASMVAWLAVKRPDACNMAALKH